MGAICPFLLMQLTKVEISHKGVPLVSSTLGTGIIYVEIYQLLRRIDAPTFSYEILMLLTKRGLIE